MINMIPLLHAYFNYVFELIQICFTICYKMNMLAHYAFSLWRLFVKYIRVYIYLFKTMAQNPMLSCPWCHCAMFDQNYVCPVCNIPTPRHHIILYLDESTICRDHTICNVNHPGPVPQVEHVYSDLVQPVANADSSNTDASVEVQPVENVIPHHIMWAGLPGPIPNLSIYTKQRCSSSDTTQEYKVPYVLNRNHHLFKLTSKSAVSRSCHYYTY